MNPITKVDKPPINSRNNDKAEKPDPDSSSGNIGVICADNTQYMVIGQCDHGICSKCSLRIRYKDSDKACPICKQLMVIIFPYRYK